MHSANEEWVSEKPKAETSNTGGSRLGPPECGFEKNPRITGVQVAEEPAPYRVAEKPDYSPVGNHLNHKGTQPKAGRIADLGITSRAYACESLVDLVVAAHRAAVEADEANFNDDGKPISKEVAAFSLAAEMAAFKAFVAIPCKSAADVQRKIGYVLNGTVGERDNLIDVLDFEEFVDGDPLRVAFLKSLIVDQP